MMVDADAIARINAIDEAITVATLAAASRGRRGDMVATVKIIPFAAPGAALDGRVRRRSATRGAVCGRAVSPVAASASSRRCCRA